MSDPKTLFLLDAYALIYRSYYAFINNPRITTTGINTSATFGFCNFLIELLELEKPTHIAVIFDPEGPTFRHEMYTPYKAQRPPMPEDLRKSIPYIKKIIAGLGISCLDAPGYEADDFIGIIHFRGHYCCHKLSREMGFQPKGLVRYQCVSGRVRFIETIAGKFFHQVENLHGKLAINPIFFRTFFKHGALFRHFLWLFLTHRTA